MKAYLTWGVGYGTKVIAMQNAQAAANIGNIKIKKLEKLEIPKCEVIESKKELGKLKGEHSGIVLQNCAKGEVAAALALAVADGKILIGHGKAGGLVKAERLADADMNKSMRDQKLTSEGINYHIAADAQPVKNQFSCAIVALVLVE